MFDRTVVLVVGDDAIVRGLIAAAVRHIGCAALETSNTRARVDDAVAALVDLVIVDESSMFSQKDAVVRQIRVAQPGIKVVRLTSRMKSLVDRRTLPGMDVFLNKPFAMNVLCDVVKFSLGDASSSVAVGSAAIN